MQNTVAHGSTVAQCLDIRLDQTHFSRISKSWIHEQLHEAHSCPNKLWMIPCFKLRLDGWQVLLQELQVGRVYYELDCNVHEDTRHRRMAACQDTCKINWFHSEDSKSSKWTCCPKHDVFFRTGWCVCILRCDTVKSSSVLAHLIAWHCDRQQINTKHKEQKLHPGMQQQKYFSSLIFLLLASERSWELFLGMCICIMNDECLPMTLKKTFNSIDLSCTS